MVGVWTGSESVWPTLGPRDPLGVRGTWELVTFHSRSTGQGWDRGGDGTIFGRTGRRGRRWYPYDTEDDHPLILTPETFPQLTRCTRGRESTVGRGVRMSWFTEPRSSSLHSYLHEGLDLSPVPVHLSVPPEVPRLLGTGVGPQGVPWTSKENP